MVSAEVGKVCKLDSIEEGFKTLPPMAQIIGGKNVIMKFFPNEKILVIFIKKKKKIYIYIYT